MENLIKAENSKNEKELIGNIIRMSSRINADQIKGFILKSMEFWEKTLKKVFLRLALNFRYIDYFEILFFFFFFF